MNFPAMPNLLSNMSQAVSQLTPQQQQMFHQFAQGLQAQANKQQQQQQQANQHNPAALAAALSSHTQKQQAAAIAAAGAKAAASSLVGIHQQQAAAAAVAAAAAAAAGGQPRPGLMAGPGPGLGGAGAADAKKGKKRKPAERSAPEKVPLNIPESEAFTQLLSEQRKVDHLIQQKRSRIKEALQLPDHVAKVLRLYIFNTHSNQPPAQAQAQAQPSASSSSTSAPTPAGTARPPTSSSAPSPSEPPCWTLYITGRVLDPEPPPAPPAPAAAGPGPGAGPIPPNQHLQPNINPFGPAAPAPQQHLPAAGGGVGFAPHMQQALGGPPGGLLAPGPAGGPMLPMPGAPSGGQAAAAAKLPATFFLRRVRIQLDPQQYPQDNVIVWEKAQHAGVFKEQLEVKRLGTQPSEVTISIEVDWQPERYVLDPRLAAVLGLQYESRARILRALWAYIKRLHLQDPKQPHHLNLPMELAQVLGTSSIHLAELSERLAPLLTPMKPLEFKHTIKLDGPSPCLTHCYDVQVALPAAQASDSLDDMIEKVNKEQELEDLDHKLSSIIQRVNEHRRRRDFLLGFAHSPTDFINALVASQARDMRQGKSVNGTDYEVERRSELFRQPWAQEAVVKYLQRRLNRMT